MAYENMTYEFIIARMIKRISIDYPNLDTREGSMVFNAVASAAMEVAIMYTELENSRNESFVQTASREYLLRACEQVGIDNMVFSATTPFFKAIFNIEIPLYSRWNLGEYNYLVVEDLGDPLGDENYTYILQCESTGSAPNTVLGDLTPIDFIHGDLWLAQIVECTIEGEDEKSDDDIRDYYTNFINHTASEGNIGQYELWCEEYPGIGNYKIIPQVEGVNTVGVVILNSSNDLASEELICEFQEYLDPGRTGMGDGVAPIGAFVIVGTAAIYGIDIEATVTLKDGYSDTTAIDTALRSYFSEIALKKDIVSYMTLGAKILEVEGVEHITNLKLNGGTEDIRMDFFEIPQLDSTDWTVI